MSGCGHRRRWSRSTAPRHCRHPGAHGRPAVGPTTTSLEPLAGDAARRSWSLAVTGGIFGDGRRPAGADVAGIARPTCGCAVRPGRQRPSPAPISGRGWSAWPASRAGVVGLRRDAARARSPFGDRPVLRVVQSPAGAFGTWVGLPFPDGRPPMVPIASMVAEIVGAVRGSPAPDLSGRSRASSSTNGPRSCRDGSNADRSRRPGCGRPTLVDVNTTGVALNANAPGCPPAADDPRRAAAPTARLDGRPPGRRAR